MDDCIHLLSQTYGEKCRVIKNQGDYDYMIRLRFGSATDSIYVQISIPTDRTIDMDIRVSGGPDKVRADLQAYLCQNDKQVDNVSEMALNLFKSADNWLAENAASKDLCKLVPQAKKSSKPKVTKLSREIEHDVIQDGPQKKAGMKTAEDVIKRLKWDNSLPADQFTVGYLDRFIGIVEKPFMAFNWEDLVNAEITDLAIPQHRIQYFCYKKVKVWDKNDRLDLVFNSVRAGPTIYDVMKQQDGMAGGTVEVNRDKSCSENEPLVDDPEQVCSLSSEPSGVDAESSDVPKGVRPDYFLAVPIDDPTLRSRVHMVQDSFGSQFPKVVKTFLDLDHLHVTVALFSTGCFPNGVENIANALTIENDRLKKLFSQIQFRGLNLLADRVLCSFPDESFKENILEPLREIFNKYNVPFYMPSVPHLTIGKLNLAKDPENLESVQNLVHSSKFNGTQILSRFVLRSVGVKTSQEFVFNLE